MWHVAREVASNTTALQCFKRIFDTFMAFMSCQVVTTLPTCVEVMHVNLLSADTYARMTMYVQDLLQCCSRDACSVTAMHTCCSAECLDFPSRDAYRTVCNKCMTCGKIGTPHVPNCLDPYFANNRCCRQLSVLIGITAALPNMMSISAACRTAPEVRLCGPLPTPRTSDPSRWPCPLGAHR